MTFAEFARRSTDRGPHGTSLPRWIRWIAFLVPLLTAAVAMASNVETRSHAAATYVRLDSAALQHLRDSLVHEAADARRDTMISGLYRACQREGRCLP